VIEIRIERSDFVFEVLMASRMNIRYHISNRTEPEPHHSEFSITKQIEPVHGEFVFRIGSVLDQAELSFYHLKRAVAI